MTDPTREARLRQYDLAAVAVPVSERCRQLALHVGARAALMTKGEDRLARGATLIGVVAAMRMAAVPASSEAEFAAKLGGLRWFAAALDDGHGEHVAALVDAALEVDVAARLEIGLTPYGRRMAGWMDGFRASSAFIDGSARVDELAGVPTPDMALYAAAAEADDVDLLLGLASDILRDLLDLSPKGSRTDGALNVLEQVAYHLCAWPVVRSDLAEMSRACVILRRILRWRRPSAAAIIRARILRGARRPVTVSMPVAYDRRHGRANGWTPE